MLQLDEPSLPAVLAGALPTASGWGTLRSVDIAIARTTLADVLAVAPEGGRVVHCCARDVPIGLLREAGADAVSIDLTLIKGSRTDELGEAVDAGTSLWLGVLPTLEARDAPPIELDTARRPLERLWSDLGFPRAQLPDAVVPTPACGLAAASPSYARRVLSVLRDVGAWMVESPE